MCGINGLYAFNGRITTDANELIRKMNSCIRHRGPDGNGIWHNELNNVYLGHQRLSIIDLSSSGHQPMIDESGNAIVFNGEIYNYAKLKSQIKDQKFNSESDTEVLLKLYKAKGHLALSELNGMFSFAFWNKDKEELQLAVDRAGKKPLYYSTINGIFSFSSELKALLSLPWIKAKLDEEALYHFLTFNQLSAPQTMFEGINKLEPGFLLTVDKSGIIEHTKYWDVNYTDYKGLNESQLSDLVFESLSKAVDNRLVSDVPVGAFLSGGVDSSAVVALMRQSVSGVIKTYSVGFEGQPEFDERVYAQQISKQFNTEHFEKIVGPNDISEFLPRIVEIFDEPMADSTCIPIYFISQLAKANGTIVVQTGDGADEIFSGYRSWMKYYHLYPWYHRFQNLPPFLKTSIATLLSSDQKESVKSEILQRAAHNQELFWGGAKAFKEHTKRSFLSAEWANKMKDVNSYSIIEKVRYQFSSIQKENPRLDDLDWMCYLGFKQQIPWKYLYRMDRIGMSQGIEIRNPFLDFNMVNLAMSISPEYKIKNGEPKYILKKSLERLLPKEILYRKKMGFCVPLQEWAGDVMIDYVESNLSEFCRNTGIFNEIGLKKNIEQIKKGNKQYTNNLWTVYFLMSWFKKWMSA